MNAQPSVTIVTPSYNQAQFLEKTILSVLEQDYPGIEYLVVDGGSTDKSVEIIQKYAQRIAWWVSEKDNGQADAINKGLRRATGDIVAWLNSDDFYLPGTISHAVQAFSENPEVAFLYGDVQVVDTAGEIINRLTYGDWGLKELMEFHIIGQPAVFMRRDALESQGFLDEGYHFLLDHQLWLRLASSSPIKHIQQVWAAEHYHPASKNVAHAGEFGIEAWHIVDWMAVDPILARLYSRNRKRIEAGAERLNAFYLFDAHDYRASLKAYLHSLRLHPGAAAGDWYRILYAMFSPLGLERLKSNYLARRKRKFKPDHS